MLLPDPALGPVPVEFILFACVLAGVALFHAHTLRIALGGALVIATYKILVSPFKTGAGLAGFTAHLGHEWVILVNLLLLLLGFALLADLFEKSEVPAVLPRYLPDDWKGCFVLLALVFVLSSFLDNIAAAMIGGAVAHTVFKGQGAHRLPGGHRGSVQRRRRRQRAGRHHHHHDVDRRHPAHRGAGSLHRRRRGLVHLRHPGLAAAAGVLADPEGRRCPGAHRLGARGHRGLHPGAAIGVNVTINTRFNALADLFPFLGAAVWVAILLGTLVRKPTWSLLPGAARGSVFLLSLVMCASMMPVDQLPPASWVTALGLGFVSAVFDNIPLTALAIKQGGYDWGFLAYAVGFGGSMIWFGSSAGVALANMYPQARSVGQWLRKGWYVAVAYVVGYFVMLAVIGFHPGATPRGG
jgi:hypothetical protein